RLCRACRARRGAPPWTAAGRRRAALVPDRMRGIRCLYRRPLLSSSVKTMKKLSVLAVCCAGLLLPAPHAVQTQAARPKLVVFLVFDQLRADYLVRYAGLYDHGLKRLSTQGAWYRNAAYPYLETLTCVGHTTIGTGTFHFKHGMIQNQWYDRETKSAVNCTTDQEAKDIPYAGTTGIADSAK